MSKNKVTLGGDRVGSGSRMRQEMHNYFRSNHNLSCSRVTSMSPGVLYPIYVNYGVTGDTFDFDIDAFMRTLPTEGPMFGAFKLQLDVFTADERLYQAILHNNTLDIGMDMDKVMLPKIEISTNAKLKESDGIELKEQIASNALLRYLGVIGLGRPTGSSIGQNGVTITRKFNASPILAYYDIFKNYYANKQEENAYVIANGDYGEIITTTSSASKIEVYWGNDESKEWKDLTTFSTLIPFGNNKTATATNYYASAIRIYGDNLYINDRYNFELDLIAAGARHPGKDPNDSSIWAPINKQNTYVELEWINDEEYSSTGVDPQNLFISKTTNETILVKSNAVNLKPFELKNIDKMRKRCLGEWDLGEELVIDSTEQLLPYKALVETDQNLTSEHVYESKNVYPLQGLVVKCYQSDMFNNWLETEWVNKITNRSRVNVTNGSFTMDALNMAKKIYNLYNRIAIQGGSYDDWQQAAYGQDVYGKAEKPVYHGGMSSEVMFDEVVSSVASADQPLGTLGGRGNLNTRKGGHVVVKVREHCIIMVMASLTPRLTYSQGNSWYMNLDTMDDFHKPEFDRIGFQDLIGEHMAWWDTKINANTMEITQTSYGKQPAWIHYQTDVDKCFGDFAGDSGKGYMVLQRLYHPDEQTGNIKDVTAYIDPSLYNYVFAVDDITAQNFWGFFEFGITARRLMSAKQIPNV